MKVKQIFEMTGGRIFSIYKAECDGPEVYYGYCRGDSDEDIRKSFFAHQHTDEGRGVVTLIKAAGGGENIKFDIMDEVDDEEKALIARNELREDDPQSVTGPSYFPPTLYNSAKTKYPEQFQKAEKKRNLRSLSTARQAYANKYFTPAQINPLAQTVGKQQLIHDLDNMAPAHFAQKHGIQINY